MTRSPKKNPVSASPPTNLKGRKHTIFGNIEPHAVLVECVLVRVEALEIPVPATIVHRGILLVTEHDALTPPAFARAFGALGALGFLLVT
jgi:hypothetical protein